MNTRGSSIRAVIAGMALVAFAGIAVGQQVVRLTFASGYPPNFLMVQEMQRTFLPEVNKELERAGNKYRIEWNVALSGTLAKIPAMLEAIETGQADVGHVPSPFVAGKLPLTQVDWYAPFSTSDHRLVTRAHEELFKVVPQFAKRWDDLGVVHLASFPLDDYVLVSKTPINSMADLKGKKIGGAGPNLNWLQGSGAVGVTTTGAAAYNDMKNGVFDALLTPLTLVPNAKYYEVAPHTYRMQFNALVVGQLAANKAKFDKWPPEVQAAMRNAAKSFQNSMFEGLDKQVADAEKVITSNGGRISVFPREERARWAASLPNIAEQWAKDQDSKGLAGTATMKAFMAFLRRNGVQPARAWDQF